VTGLLDLLAAGKLRLHSFEDYVGCWQLAHHYEEYEQGVDAQRLNESQRDNHRHLDCAGQIGLARHCFHCGAANFSLAKGASKRSDWDAEKDAEGKSHKIQITHRELLLVLV
jgi:hypothetical protein